MASAYVLINCAPGKVLEVVGKLEILKFTKSVESITGMYDAIALIEGGPFEELSHLVLTDIHKIDGVRSTVTCLVIPRRR